MAACSIGSFGEVLGRGERFLHGRNIVGDGNQELVITARFERLLSWTSRGGGILAHLLEHDDALKVLKTNDPFGTNIGEVLESNLEESVGDDVGSIQELEDLVDVVVLEDIDLVDLEESERHLEEHDAALKEEHVQDSHRHLPREHFDIKIEEPDERNHRQREVDHLKVCRKAGHVLHEKNRQHLLIQHRTNHHRAVVVR